jgi:hypothetical protein
MLRSLYFLTFFLILFSLACGDKKEDAITPVPDKGNRLFAIDISARNGGTYDEAFTLCKSEGVDFVQLSLQWDVLETAPGTYDDTLLNIAEAYYPPQNMKLALNINSIDTSADRRPADLKALAWDNAAVIQRYKNLIDHILAKIPSVTLVSFAVGNEVDVFLGSDNSKWTAYTAFVTQTSAYLQTKLSSSVFIGVKTRLESAASTQQAKIQSLNAAATGILLTYYPINSDFTVKNPTVVSGDFNTITSVYQTKPILFLEAGFQSGSLCLSSEEKQKQFIINIFSAWDTHKDSIRAINFVWLHDLSQAEVDTLAAYYGLSDPIFKDYLKTLGLRNNDGSVKLAYTELIAQKDARGW